MVGWMEGGTITVVLQGMEGDTVVEVPAEYEKVN